MALIKTPLSCIQHCTFYTEMHRKLFAFIIQTFNEEIQDCLTWGKNNIAPHLKSTGTYLPVKNDESELGFPKIKSKTTLSIGNYCLKTLTYTHACKTCVYALKV